MEKVKRSKSSTKKYQLFIATTLERKTNAFCSACIGDGTTFCIHINCQVNHIGAAPKVSVPPGSVYIQASKNRAFLQPNVSSCNWTEALLEEWSTAYATMDEWLDRFRAIEALEDLEPTSKIDIAAVENEIKQVSTLNNLQSVRKSKRPEEVKLQLMDYTLGANFDELPEDGFNLESIANAISMMDRTIHYLINNVTILHNDHIQIEDWVKPSLHQGEEAIKLLGAKLRSKPSYLCSAFDSPSILTSLGLMSSELVNISNQFSFELKQTQSNVRNAVLNEMIGLCNPEFESLNERLNNMRDTLLSLLGTVGKLVEENQTTKATAEQEDGRSVKPRLSHHSKRSRLSNQLPSTDYLSSEDENALGDSSYSSVSNVQKHNHVRTLLNRGTAHSDDSRSSPRSKRQRVSSSNTRLDRIEKDIRALKALKDGLAVKFCGLGFKSRKDADHWLRDHSEGDNFGLVVDIHTIFEHFYALIFGKDSAFSNLHNLARIKLETDIEGIAVSSFEQQIPKLFSKASFKIIRNDASYFDTIPTHNPRITSSIQG